VSLNPIHGEVYSIKHYGDKADVGNIAKTSQPIIKQLIIAKADDIDTPAFERAQNYLSRILQFQ
jgi:hypothetical protein